MVSVSDSLGNASLHVPRSYIMLLRRSDKALKGLFGKIQWAMKITLIIYLYLKD